MSFELHIECSKNIDYLEINFSDGTSVMKQTDKKYPKNTKKEKYIDFGYSDDPVSQDIVKKPEIPDVKRSAKVADELQNMDV